MTPDVSFEGAVLVEGKLITCVEAGTACSSRPGAAGATVIDTHGVIAPGLIDAHNHILYDIFDDSDWVPAQTYVDHSQWTKEARYQAMVDVKQCLNNDSQGKPAWCPTKYTGQGSMKCEMNKWGELKGVVAGTTSIVGLPGTSSPCFSSLARTIDTPHNGLGVDTVQATALTPSTATSTICTNMDQGTTKAYLLHCAEGTGGAASKEFQTLYDVTTPTGCLYRKETTLIHGVAMTDAQVDTMAQNSMKLVWSAKSNYALYGATAPIPKYVSAGVLIALGADWSMGGSTNMLDEMRFANHIDDTVFGDLFTPKDIVTMATKNGAIVLAYDDRLGQLKEGYLADLFVVPGTSVAPYDDILAATPRTVRLTMVGGRVLYGDAQLVAAGPATPACETLEVCGASKFVCAAESSSANKLDQPFSQIKSALEAALVDVDTVANVQWKFAPLSPLTQCP